jgi:hypothetical protein
MSDLGSVRARMLLVVTGAATLAVAAVQASAAADQPYDVGK